MAGDLEYFGVPPQEMRDVETRPEYSAAAGQTVFAVSYNPGYVDVFRNGVLQAQSSFTAANGTSVTLSVPCESGEHIRFTSRRQVAMSDAHTKAEANSLNNNFYAVATGTGDAAVCTTEPSVGFSLVDGREVKVRWPANNTIVNPTLNVNGTGVKTLVMSGGYTVPPGTLTTGRELTIRYNVTSGNFEVTNVSSVLESPIMTGNPTAPTPAQFDSDTSLATTAFIQRALGNWRGAKSTPAGTVLTAADTGNLCYFSGTTGTVTLPLLNSVVEGASFLIKNYTNINCTVATSGGNYIYGRGTNTQTSIVIAGGEELLFVSNGAVWFAIGTGSLGKIASFDATLAASGYQKLPSGLIIQWISVTSSGTGGNNAAISFPIAFPNACLKVIPTTAGAGNSNAQFVNATLAAANITAYVGATITSGIVVNVLAIGY